MFAVLLLATRLTWTINEIVNEIWSTESGQEDPMSWEFNAIATADDDIGKFSLLSHFEEKLPPMSLPSAYVIGTRIHYYHLPSSNLTFAQVALRSLTTVAVVAAVRLGPWI